MADIFISYSQKDREWVKKLVDALMTERYEVWWDLDIRAGESIGKAIERMLPLTKCVVVVWSQDAKKSNWVRAESAWAKERNKLVSIRIQDELELPIDFYDILTDNFSAWDGSSNAPEFRKLVTDIRKIAGPPPAPPETAPAPGPEVVSAPQAAPEPALAAQLNPEHLSQPRAEPAPRAESGPLREAEQEFTEPEPPVTPGRRNVVVGMISLAVSVFLVGGVYYVGSTYRGEVAPLPVFRDTLEDGSQGPEMVVIPDGQFEMGCVSGKDCEDDELPVHPVAFGKPFAIGKYEVTFDEYKRYALATGGRKPNDEGWGHGRRPVINVSWDEAGKYAAWLSEKTGKHYRLPTEAEWEYAARAGTKTRWSFGDDEGVLGKYAWYQGNSDDKTHPVGGKSANPWGIRDVHGNVWEWVEDCWHDNSEGVPTDEKASEEAGGGECGRRVIRGGAWNYTTGNLRSAKRGWNDADFPYNYLGFRVAQDL